MRVLIDKQAAIDALHEWEMVYTWDETCLEDMEKVYAPSEVIEDLPDAEPEIVRCKDCINYTRGKDEYGSCFENPMKLWRDTDYCSWAERRTDG